MSSLGVDARSILESANTNEMSTIEHCKVMVRLINSWNKSAENWQANKSTTTELESDDILAIQSLPNVFVTLIVSSLNTIHDSYLSGFNLAIDVLHAANHISQSSVTYLLSVSILSIRQLDPTTTINLKKVELLFGALIVLYDTKIDTVSLYDSIENSIEVCIYIQTTMKTSLQTVTNIKQSPNEIKLYRNTCSDVRKAAISLLKTIFKRYPNYVIRNVYQYWNLTITTFTTSILFAIGYIALKTSPEEYQTDNNVIITKMVQYLYDNLIKFTRYSLPMATELIETTVELCDADCIELILHTQSQSETQALSLSPAPVQSLDFCHSLLCAYIGKPKLSVKETSEDLSEWKILTASALSSLLQLYIRHQHHHTVAGHHIINTSTLLLIISTLSSDLFILHVHLGINTSSSSSTSSTNSTDIHIDSDGAVATALTTTDIDAGLNPPPQIAANIDASTSRSSGKESTSEAVVRGRGRGRGRAVGDIAGSSEAEATVSVLLSVTTALRHSIQLLDCNSSPEIFLELNETCERLCVAMYRDVVFDDDAVQLCSEIALVATIICRLMYCVYENKSFHVDDRSVHRIMIAKAVKALYTCMYVKKNTFGVVINEACMEALLEIFSSATGGNGVSSEEKELRLGRLTSKLASGLNADCVENNMASIDDILREFEYCEI